MAVTYVSSPGNDKFGGTNSVEIASFTTSGSDRALWVGIGLAGTNREVSSVSRNSGSETFTEWWDTGIHGSEFRSWGYYYLNPTTSSASLTVTMAGTTEGGVHVALLNGTGSVDTANTAIGNSLDDDCTVSVNGATDEIVVAMLSYDQAISTIDGSGTTIAHTDTGINNDQESGYWPGEGDGTVAAGWLLTNLSSANEWVIGAGAFAEAGGATPKSFLTLLGVG